MLSIELELISVVSNPKGLNQEPFIRIRGRYIFNVSLTSKETRFSVKCNVFKRIRAYLRCVEPGGGKSSALYQNPRVNVFLTFSWHLKKHVFLLNVMFAIEFEFTSVVLNPAGGIQALSIRIRPRYVGLSTKPCVFVWGRAHLHYIKPEGGKSSALYQNPATMRLFEKTICRRLS